MNNSCAAAHSQASARRLKPAKAHVDNLQTLERLHGTVRERDKVMRALKKEESDILEGLRIYYNFVRPHMALNGKNPAEMAGINLQFEQNKWESLIRKSVISKNRFQI